MWRCQPGAEEEGEWSPPTWGKCHIPCLERVRQDLREDDNSPELMDEAATHPGEAYLG